jgi:hypothetical protein
VISKVRPPEAAEVALLSPELAGCDAGGASLEFALALIIVR